MRVENAGVGLNNADCAIVGSDGEEVALAVRDDGRESHQEILGVHLGGKAVANGLLLTGRDLDTVANGGQVADDLGLIIRVPQASTDEVHGDWVRLIVGDGNQCLGRVTVDKLDAEDLGSREGSLGSDSQADSLWFRGLLSIL